MKKVYIAKRIPLNAEPKIILPLNIDMLPEEVHKKYVENCEIKESYIYNGPWILRAPLSDSDFSQKSIPESLKPIHVWNMVREKIISSDVVVGIVNSKAYGTIAEVAYACSCKNIATYVLPDLFSSEEEIQDLWFIFQMVQSSKDLWSDDDIKNIPEFQEHSISSLEEYKTMVEKITPNFLKK